MIAKTLVLLLAGVALGEVARADMALPHLPLIMWSKRSTFQSTESYVSAALDEIAVVSTLQRAMGASKSNAELLAVFLPTTLHTQDVAKFTAAGATHSFVQTAVTDATSSAVIPHTTRTKSLLHALGDSSVAFSDVPVEELESFLSTRKGQALATNGQTDLLVVRITTDSHSLPETDALIQAASEVLVSATKGAVDFALTGDAAVPTQLPASVPSARRRRLAAANTTKTTAVGALVCETGLTLGYSGGKAFCFSHYVHMTPEVLTGLLFGLFFIFLAYIGISALSAIQTPTRYPHHGPPRGKEF